MRKDISRLRWANAKALGWAYVRPVQGTAKGLGWLVNIRREESGGKWDWRGSTGLTTQGFLLWIFFSQVWWEACGGSCFGKQLDLVNLWRGRTQKGARGKAGSTGKRLVQEPRGRRLVAGQGSPAGGQMRLDSGQSAGFCWWIGWRAWETRSRMSRNLCLCLSE